MLGNMFSLILIPLATLARWRNHSPPFTKGGWEGFKKGVFLAIEGATLN